VGHEGAFAGDRLGTDWMVEDLPWGYGAEVSALTFHDNSVRVTLLPGDRPGDPVVLEVEPETSYVDIVSSVVTGPAGAEEEIVLDRPLGSHRVRLSGVLPPGGEWDEDVAVEDPARFAATALAEVLEDRGITVTGGVATASDPLPADTRVLAVHEGVSLTRRIQEVNRESLNLHAELLLRLVGREASGEGTTESGLEAVEGFLDRLEVPRDGWRLRDGSGLSHTNLVTPRGLVTLLAAMDRHPHAETFRASLSVAGVSGQLEERLLGTPAVGRVAAKTGALRGVTTLAGYAPTAGGEGLAFAVLVNNHTTSTATAKTAIDEIVFALSTAR
jgi:D-alanyl-D-alanine carboxypeptidase/D-alanyl-D-alanine-endopeptidase (penicillin-binding protein 4)